MERLKKSNMQTERRSEATACYLMILTEIVGFLVLTCYPIIWTFRWSWFSYNGIPSQTRFIGWDNFKTIFTTDFTYWKTWLNTLKFTALKIPGEFVLSMGTALILKREIKGGNFFRTVFYLPSIISVVVIGLVFSNLFGYRGFVNGVLVKTGILKTAIDWFSTGPKAMFVLVTGSIWNTFGVNVLYYLAAFCNVPQEMYESAKLDGASPWTTFIRITMPMIAPVFKIVLMLSIIGTIGINEYIIVLTNGGPSGQTATVMSYLTKQFVPGFAEETAPALGYGCAMSLVTTIIFALIAWLYNVFSKKVSSIS